MFSGGMEKDQWHEICKRPMFPSYRNQSFDLKGKSTDWFLTNAEEQQRMLLL